MSLASFSFTASEIGPNTTTGLLKPAEKKEIQIQLQASKMDWTQKKKGFDNDLQ